MTEEDWQASDNVLVEPAEPGIGDIIAKLLPKALELAEDEVYELLALFTISNADVKKRAPLRGRHQGRPRDPRATTSSTTRCSPSSSSSPSSPARSSRATTAARPTSSASGWETR